jgi:predicted kinase
MLRPKLILICGPAGAGKTTLAKSLIAEGKADSFFEADMWMVDSVIGDYQFNPKKLGYCHNMCQSFVDKNLKNGKTVICSNTTLTKKEARPYIEMAKKYGAEVEIIHVQTQFKSVHSVPELKVKQMQDKREFFTLEDFD